MSNFYTKYSKHEKLNNYTCSNDARLNILIPIFKYLGIFVRKY